MIWFDKITFWLLLVIFGALLLLVFLGTLDNIIQNISSIRGSAKVVNIDKLGGSDYLITYSYFNEFRGKEYSLRKVISKRSFDKIKGQESIEIEYVSYFPKTPRIVDIESNKSLVLMILGFAVIFFSFYRTLLAIRGKITISQFLGVKKT